MLDSSHAEQSNVNVNGITFHFATQIHIECFQRPDLKFKERNSKVNNTRRQAKRVAQPQRHELITNLEKEPTPLYTFLKLLKRGESGVCVCYIYIYEPEVWTLSSPWLDTSQEKIDKRMCIGLPDLV